MKKRQPMSWLFDSSMPEFLFFVICMVILAAAMTYYPEPLKYTPIQSTTSCIDGFVAQWDGRSWVQVKLKGGDISVPCGPYGGGR